MGIDEDLPPALVDIDAVDEDLPPTLVEAGDADITDDDDAPSMKVPITIVTGKAH